MIASASPATGNPDATVATAAARATATKFEALVMGEMLKSMRSAKLDEGTFESDAEGHWAEMRDQQFAQSLPNATRSASPPTSKAPPNERPA